MFKLRVISVLIVLVCVFSAGAAYAADTLVIASVNTNKVMDGYKLRGQLEQELQAFAQQYFIKRDLRVNNRFLSEEDLDMLAQLKCKEKPLSDDTDRITALEAKSKQFEQEFQTLMQKQNASDQEKARLKEMQARVSGLEGVTKQQDEAYNKEFQAKKNEMLDRLFKDIEDAVAAVAKQKKITVVFNNMEGPLGQVVYCSMDITSDVISKLNK